MAATDTATVTLSVNGREVTVPKGRSLVEAAAAAGIEIPVFCYEPRLGAGIGACRMCLCEIEGMPKLQTACTTPAADGMVVHSHSDRAREGQDAVLEFLLLNHPLDCPVCDKGGECPLQDLTFRYGPPVTRMRIPKRTQEKPVPISPLITLDRERCILCYRCTRFSEGVSGDMQLVTENRGAHSVITTFEGRPYAGEFSGNVTELCPVGALTSTTYRFRGRPWEIQNIPTTCGLCPVGCNTAATVREGRVVRILSRNNPEIDEGWLCDKGRYAIGLETSGDRVRDCLIRGGRGLETVSPSDALDHVADRLRATVERFGPGSVAVIASGEQTNEEAAAWASLAERAFGGGPTVVGPEDGAGWLALEEHAATIADLTAAGTIVVAGDVDLVHRAPVVELRIRKAVAAGARLVTVGAGGTRLETLRGATHVSSVGGDLREVELGDDAGDVVVVWTGRMNRSVADLLGHFARERGWRILRTPRTSNELGCRVSGLGTATPAGALDAAEAGQVRAVVLLGADVVGDWANGERWRAVLGRAFFALQVTTAQNDSSGWATTIMPGATLLEQDGTVTNLDGRVQPVRAATQPPPGTGRALAEGLAARLGVELGPVGPPQAHPETMRTISVASGGRGDMAAIGYRQLMSGPAVDATPRLHFQRRVGIEISDEDATLRGIATGDRVRVTHDGSTHEGPAVVRRGLRAGVVRLPVRVPFEGMATLEVVDGDA